MYTSEHAVEPSFTVKDLKDLIGAHNEMIASYDFVLNAIDSKSMNELFVRVQHSHKRDRQKLIDLIRLYNDRLYNNGKVQAEDEHRIAVSKRMRLLISTRMSSATDLINEMRHGEAQLIDVYGRNINSLTRLDQLEPILNENMDNAQERLDLLLDNTDHSHYHSA